MSKVYRVFVEKKKGNDIEAGQTLADLKNNVGITALEDLRIINRYDAQGLSENLTRLLRQFFLSRTLIMYIASLIFLMIGDILLPSTYPVSMTREPTRLRSVFSYLLQAKDLTFFLQRLSQLRATSQMRNLKRLSLISSTLLSQELQAWSFPKALT